MLLWAAISQFLRVCSDWTLKVNQSSGYLDIPEEIFSLKTPKWTMVQNQKLLSNRSELRFGPSFFSLNRLRGQ